MIKPTVATVLLLLVFSISMTHQWSPGNYKLEFVKTQFGFLEKFIHYKDTEAIHQFLSGYFSLGRCNGTRIKRNEFVNAVLQMPSNSPFHVEVDGVDYGNNRNPSLEYLRINMTIHGFGKPFPAKSFYGVADLEVKPVFDMLVETGCN